MSELRPTDAAIDQLKRHYTPGPGRPSQDPEPDLSTTSATEDLPDELTWPPPGLAHLHALMPRVTGSLYLAALVLIATLAAPQLLDRTPEYGSWGSVIAFIITGTMLFAAYMWLMVMFNRAADGVTLGYPRALVWQVATDSARNTPHVLRGTGAYERLTLEQRTALLRDRVTASAFALAGALWLTTGIPLLVALAANGMIGRSSFWWIVFVPAAFLVLVSVYFRVREARVDYGNRIPDEEDRNTAQQARGWRHLLERAGYAERRTRVGTYRVAAASAAFAVFLILVPIALASFSMIIPQIAPGAQNLYTNAIRMSAFAPLRAYAARDESIAAGFQLADTSATLEDAQNASLMVQQGAQRLAGRLRAGGSPEHAAHIEGVIDAANAAANAGLRLARANRPTLRALRSIVFDPTIPRAYRWEAFRTVAASARCGSLPALLFGPGERHRQFVERARIVLIQSSTDSARFEAAQPLAKCSIDRVFRQLRGRP